MLGNPRDIITAAERQFPVRIMIGIPPDGLGQQYHQMTAWLDQNCGADGWAMTSLTRRGHLDALSIYLLNPAFATAFVTRWCLGYIVKPTGGAFQLREDEPLQRSMAPLHRTP